jgi:uroporphyrin-III C-methyltransferase
VNHKTQVYLVGAGPGDTGLITVKGLRCLQQADVVLYDKLANPKFLEEAPDGAELIYVGKVKGNHLLPQEQINELLEEKAQPGRIVVRLKGGDPYIFGRGGEEAQHLGKVGVPFEVVPGITAGFAAATYAGIPVTHRDCTTSVSLITGHAKPGNEEQSDVDWKALASGNGTLVFYMGLSNIATICQELIRNGRAASTPVAIVSCATTERQQTFTTTLGEAPQKAEKNKIPTPSVIVVGEVVSLREQLRWFDSDPLLEQGSLLSKTPGHSTKKNEQLAEAVGDQSSFLEVEVEPPKSLPVLLKSPRILLMGGGKVAYRKAKILVDNHVEFNVIAQSFHHSFENLEGKIDLIKKQIQSADLISFNVIVDATGNQMIADLVHSEKQKRFVLSNFVDDPDGSDFYFSSLLNYGLLKIAVSTEGASPTVGKIVRDKIKASIPEGFNELLRGKARARKSGVIEPDLAREQSFALYAQLNMICCHLGAADPLSQRACRCLSQMDVVLYDRLVPAEVLDLVSGHAQKVLLEEPCDSINRDKTNRMVADYLCKGKRVARIKSVEQDGFPQLFEEVEFFSRHGFEVVMIPISNSG